MTISYNPSFKGPHPKDFFIVSCIGLLDHLYSDFHSPNFLNIFYPLLSFIGLLHLLVHFTPLSFFPCIHTSLLLFFLRMGFYYILRMGFSFIVSNSLLFTSSTFSYLFLPFTVLLRFLLFYYTLF